jgi:phospholipid transport system substrate-binding protein
MIRLRTAAAVVLVLSWLGATGVRAVTQSEASAHAVIEKTVKEVLAVLDDKSVSTEKRLHSIEEIVYGRFDLQTMSRLVLARNWKRFSKEQQLEYVSEFKKYLSNNYGSRIERYDQERVEILDARDEPRGDVIVRTKIVGGQYEGALVDYRLRNTAGAWRVIDVVIEGISMVSNFRDQFKAVVSRSGPEGLLKELKEKNAAEVKKKKAAEVEEEKADVSDSSGASDRGDVRNPGWIVQSPLAKAEDVVALSGFAIRPLPVHLCFLEAGLLQEIAKLGN